MGLNSGFWKWPNTVTLDFPNGPIPCFAAVTAFNHSLGRQQKINKKINKHLKKI